MDTKYLEQVREVTKLLTGSLTKDDFTRAFKALTDLVLKLDKKWGGEAQNIRALAEQTAKKLAYDSASDLAEIKKEVASQVASMAATLEAKLQAADEKMDALQDGKDGQDGIDADEQAVADLVKAQIHIPTIDELEKDIPKLGMEIRDALELLTGDDRLSVESIRGLKEEIDALKVARTQGPIGRAGGEFHREHIKDIDISDQLNGSSSTFNIPAVYNIISVVLSSFPTVLRKNIDFTFTGTTITFTNQISPSSTLAAGQTCIITAVLA